jgi:hypothetical protein
MYYITGMLSMDEKTETITLRVSPELRAKLRDWRRNHPDLPDESKAIRLMIEAMTEPKGKKR